MHHGPFPLSVVFLAALVAISPVHAQVGSIIQVTTTADSIAADGLCSLREAIAASNSNGNADGSAAGCTGTGLDSIRFGLGSGNPVINVGPTALPLITDRVTISGNTGGATRVVLHSVGASIEGLHIGATAASSTVRYLVMQGFTSAILVEGANSVVYGNYLGTDPSGASAAGNSYGVTVSANGVRVGGTAGVTPGGPCTGECNLLSGNSVGVRLADYGSGTTILGNLIGTNLSGTAAIPNGSGIRLDNITSGVTIGGTATGAGNLVSGNTTGINIVTTSSAVAPSLIQGNRIGTDAGGTAAIPNDTGISLNFKNKNFPLTIGGAAAGAANVISGNNADAMALLAADNVVIRGNFIGTRADGTTPLPNGGPGVWLSSSTHNNLIGGIGAGEGNVIANNSMGVGISINNYYNEVRGNSIHDNAGKGIQLYDQQSNTISLPVIAGLAPVHGTACPACAVDVYSDAADEGRVYEGSTVADAGGNWSYASAVTGPAVTATATSTGGSTSEFSVPVVDTDGDGVPNPGDNCTLVANATQLDADADGYGNICDADLNNSGQVTAGDYSILRSVIGQSAGSSPTAAKADLNGSGSVTAADYAILRARIGSAPGPSGYACAGTIPCP